MVKNNIVQTFIKCQFLFYLLTNETHAANTIISDINKFFVIYTFKTMLKQISLRQIFKFFSKGQHRQKAAELKSRLIYTDKNVYSCAQFMWCTHTHIICLYTSTINSNNDGGEVRVKAIERHSILFFLNVSSLLVLETKKGVG